jgi:hypothetical protein
MNHERYLQMLQSSTDSGAIAVAQTEVDHRCGEIRMFSRIQASFDISRGDDSCAGGAQRLFNFERDKRLILNKEDKSSCKTTRWHRRSPRIGFHLTLTANRDEVMKA